MTVVHLRALPLEDHNCIISKYLVIINFERDSAGVEGKATDPSILDHSRSLCKQHVYVLDHSLLRDCFCRHRLTSQHMMHTLLFPRVALTSMAELRANLLASTPGMH